MSWKSFGVTKRSPCFRFKHCDRIAGVRPALTNSLVASFSIRVLSHQRSSRRTSAWLATTQSNFGGRMATTVGCLRSLISAILLAFRVKKPTDDPLQSVFHQRPQWPDSADLSSADGTSQSPVFHLVRDLKTATARGIRSRLFRWIAQQPCLITDGFCCDRKDPTQDRFPAGGRFATLPAKLPQHHKPRNLPATIFVG